MLTRNSFSNLQLLSGVNVWGLNVFRASDFVVQKRVLTCVNFKIYQVFIDNTDPIRPHAQIHMQTHGRKETYSTPSKSRRRPSCVSCSPWRTATAKTRTTTASTRLTSHRFYPKKRHLSNDVYENVSFSSVPVDSCPAQFA